MSPQRRKQAKGAAATELKRMLARRKQISQKFISGRWSAELDGYEASRAADKRTVQTLIPALV